MSIFYQKLPKVVIAKITMTCSKIFFFLVFLPECRQSLHIPEIHDSVTSRDYIFYFSQWYAQVLLIFAPTFRREGAHQACGAYDRDRWNNFFFLIFIYLNKHKNFYSRIEQSLKFILIYNLNLNLSFLFLFTRTIALIDARSWLLFSM